MRTHPKRLVKRIQANLTSPESVDQLQTLSVEYANICSNVNRRLEQIRLFIERNQPVVAMETAEAGYPLVDLIDILQFPELSQWFQIIKENHLIQAERISEDDVHVLHELYLNHKADSPILYRDYRCAILDNDEEKARRILRALIRLDEKDTNASSELARLERKAIREKEVELQTLMDSGEDDAVLELIRDLEQFPWTVGPGGEVWQRALNYRNQIQDQKAGIYSREILQAWVNATESEDLAKAEQLAAEFAAYSNEFNLDLTDEEVEIVQSLSSWLRESLELQEKVRTSKLALRKYEAKAEAVEKSLPLSRIPPLKLQKQREDLNQLWSSIIPEIGEESEEWLNHDSRNQQIELKLKEILAHQRQLAISIVAVGAIALFISFTLMFKMQRERGFLNDITTAFNARDTSALGTALNQWDDRRLPILRGADSAREVEEAREWWSVRHTRRLQDMSHLEEFQTIDWGGVASNQLMQRKTRLSDLGIEEDDAELQELRSSALRSIDQERTRRDDQLGNRIRHQYNSLMATLEEQETTLLSGQTMTEDPDLLQNDLETLATLLEEREVLEVSTTEDRALLQSAKERLSILQDADQIRRRIDSLTATSTEPEATRQALRRLREMNNDFVTGLDSLRQLSTIWDNQSSPDTVWFRSWALPLRERLGDDLGSLLLPAESIAPESSRIIRFLEQDLLGRVWIATVEAHGEGSEDERFLFLGPPPEAETMALGNTRETTQTLERIFVEPGSRQIDRQPDSLLWITDLDGRPRQGSRLRESRPTAESLAFRDLAEMLRFDSRQGNLRRPLVDSIDQIISKRDLDPGYRAFVLEFLSELMIERPDRWNTRLMPSLRTLQEKIESIRGESSTLEIWLNGDRRSGKKVSLDQLFREIEQTPLRAEVEFSLSALRRLSRQPLSFQGIAGEAGEVRLTLEENEAGVLIGIDRQGNWAFLRSNEGDGWFPLADAHPFSPLYLFGDSPSLILESTPGFNRYPREFILNNQATPFRLPQ